MVARPSLIPIKNLGARGGARNAEMTRVEIFYLSYVFDCFIEELMSCGSSFKSALFLLM